MPGNIEKTLFSIEEVVILCLHLRTLSLETLINTQLTL